MANILYLMPGVNFAADEKTRRERVANGFLLSPTSKVTVDDCEEGPISIESRTESAMSVPGMLKKALAVRSRYDALVVGCAGDPGLHVARELLDIPVVGPFESSIAVASMLGDRFSVVTILDEIVPEFWSTLREYGQANKCASVRAVDARVIDMIEGRVGRDDVVAAISGEVRRAVKDGAASIILGCMTLAFLLIDEDIKLDVPIVNPARAAIMTAEMLVRMGLKHSPVSYPKPDLGKIASTLLPELGRI